MNKTITNLSCRVCLNVEELMVHIYEEVEDLNSDLSSLLELCGDLKVDKADPYPKYLCKECTSELLIAAKFREKCNKTKEILSQIKLEFGSAESNSTHANKENALVETDYVPHHINQQFLNNKNDQEFDDACQSLDSSERYLYDNEQSSFEAQPEFILYEEDELNGDVIDIVNTTVAESPELITKTDSNEGKQCNKKELKYLCDICGAVFAYAQNLTKHFANNHDTSEIYRCKVCDHVFSLEENYSEHYKIHDCPIPDNCCVTDETRIAKKKCNQTLEPKVCEYCNKECQSTFALNMHIRTHTGERPFSCEMCDKSFKSNAALKGHVKRHTGVKDFICTYCSKSFFEQNNLKAHLLTHTGEKPHSCAVCSKRFSRVFLLQLHMRTHTGEKPYGCPYCKRAFAQLCDAKNHIRIHTGERQFQCPACIKNFTKRKALLLHMQAIHPKFEVTDDEEENSNIAAYFQYEENSKIDNDDHVNQELLEIQEIQF